MEREVKTRLDKIKIGIFKATKKVVTSPLIIPYPPRNLIKENM